MAARAQYRQQQKRPGQRRQEAADDDYEEMRDVGLRVEDSGGVGADAEERGAGEIDHAGITELDVQAQRRHAVEQHRHHQQQHEMVVVKEAGEGERRHDGSAAEGVIMGGERAADLLEQSEPGGAGNGGDADGEQRDNKRLPLGREQPREVDGRARQRAENGPQRRLGLLRRHPLKPAR